ncbi:MAG: hypothetical protein LBR12_00920 [Opitutaceae bacterium]|jgi:GntP family gluconate:H+ symporter|nr:hypothetical protein [Opitutaceae bacterium]
MTRLLETLRDTQTAAGAVTGLALAILLVCRRQNPVYSLIFGALAGGLIGGLGLGGTVATMIAGVKDVVPAIVRILTAGVLSGALVKTGAARRIAGALTGWLGQRNTLFALAAATMFLTAIGVFIDVAVITIAPIALAAGRTLPVSRLKLLLAMIGGGKCGNIISPNPNTIIAAENMGAPLPPVMAANLLPALLGLAALAVILRFARLPGEPAGAGAAADDGDGDKPPPLWASLSGPAVAIGLLALRPLCGVTVDPLVALPAGGIAGILCAGQWRRLGASLAFGLEKMGAVALLLVGTGTIAGVIKASVLGELLLKGLGAAGIGGGLLAPVSGALMSAATASTTAGAAVASASFSQMILAAGVSAVWGAAMINSGATVLDHLPHGSFFHATAGAMQAGPRERLRLLPWETLIGAILAALTAAACFV